MIQEISINNQDKGKQIVELLDTVQPRLQGQSAQDDRLMLAKFIKRLDSVDNLITRAVKHQLQNYAIYDSPNRYSSENLYAAKVPLDDLSKSFLLIGFVQPSKSKSAYFEALTYEKIAPKDEKLFLSKACPIYLLSSTSGLGSRNLLGVFPENFGNGKRSQQFLANAEAFYFVNRFADRFLRYTKSVLVNCTTDASFKHLKEFIDRDDLQSIVTDWAGTWLARHEFMHFRQPLSLNEPGKIKFCVFTGGLEEMTADLHAILSLVDEAPQQLALAEYILAERIFSYAMVDLANETSAEKWYNFDTVGGQYLLLNLLKENAITIVGNGQIMLRSHWIETVRNVANRLHDFESYLASKYENCSRNDKGKGIQHELREHTKSTIYQEFPSMERGVLLNDFDQDFPMLELYRGFLNRVMVS